MHLFSIMAFMKTNLCEYLFHGEATQVTAAIAVHHLSLHSTEQDFLSNSSEKRSHEFLTGRFCARNADLSHLRQPRQTSLAHANVVAPISPADSHPSSG